ncbi:UNVERIFIED_CONTAM: hypothetical protein FKN15_067700 [Acipenser sinensis]
MQTDLFGEPPRPEEEPQEASDDDRKHREDQQPVPFAHVLDPNPHGIQSYSHCNIPGWTDQHPIYVRSVSKSTWRLLFIHSFEFCL